MSNPREGLARSVQVRLARHAFGTRNSRMKDYFDLYALARESAVDAAVLADAIAATFERRATDVPAELPAGLREDFARSQSVQDQWRAFLTRNRIDAPPLEQVVARVGDFVLEPLRVARARMRGA